MVCRAQRGGETADDDAPELVIRSDPVPTPAVFCSAHGCVRRVPQQGNLCLRCTQPHVGGLCPLCSAIERLRRAALELDAESAFARQVQIIAGELAKMSRSEAFQQQCDARAEAPEQPRDKRSRS